MTSYPFSTLATLLALLVFLALSTAVSRARVAHGVMAPATSGHPDFDRRFRVQANTLEQLVLLLPALWLCAVSTGDVWAAAGGVIWCAGRLLYARQYVANPAGRATGFVLTIAPTLAMMLAAALTTLTTLL